jgi:predicted amidophosphoribosyltransferase
VFTAIDDLLRPLYPHLTAADQCYFLREYTAGRGYAGSETNHLILNLKKPPDRQGKPEWRYKERAIEQVAREFRASVNLSALRRVTLVPMPPSKAQSDPLYDDRMLHVLRAVDAEGHLDIRALLRIRESTDAAHTAPLRPSIADLVANLEIDGDLAEPAPKSIALVDDVLTTGAHFVAAKTVLAARFPSVPIRGLFVARRVFDDETA